MVPLDRALVSSYRLSIVTMSLTAAVWPQFATQVFRGGIGRLTCIGSYVNKQLTTFTFRAQATTCSKHHTRTVMDAGCECAPWVRSANPSNSWALVSSSFSLSNNIFSFMFCVYRLRFGYIRHVGASMPTTRPLVCACWWWSDTYNSQTGWDRSVGRKATSATSSCTTASPLFYSADNTQPLQSRK